MESVLANRGSRSLPRLSLIGAVLVVIAFGVHLVYFAGMPVGGVAKAISGFLNFPVFMMTIVPSIAAGEPIPRDGAVYVGLYVAAWAGAALFIIGLWRGRRSTTTTPILRSSEMADAVHVSANTTSRAAVSKALGGHPVARFASNLAKLLGASLIVVIVLCFMGPVGKLFALLVVGAWTILILFALGRGIAAVVNGGRHFDPAVDAVSSGRIGISYAVRGVLCTGGIVVIDENQRRVWLNGRVMEFGDITTVRWETQGNKHHLLITAKSGAEPVTTLVFDADGEMRQAYARLCNSFGLT